ncbi:sigma 54-interacting transcriptional regulator [Aneurinibacillus terranovensis]|uniref:sigma 54-interacting transcriptional regulator n=1 Tax=Aneurinibacillus terranovensis TaxID=278991 RepID=UPI00041C39AD|nr:sigma-54-dependent transcriptional regulator [Aneurinibacillus terranovensis]
MKNAERVIYNFLQEACEKQKASGQTEKIGCTTNEVADALSLQRTNVSAVLNKLSSEGKIVKIKGKPVIYTMNLSDSGENGSKTAVTFDTLIGNNDSLKKSIQQAKAAILYPPDGLHTLLLGETGVGKTMFAELMYKFAIEKGVLALQAPFVSFNCADYANNPQLLLSHLFGSKRGAFTGADRDREGIVEKANGGILFLDEVHRLPPEAQEMLFMLIDKGTFTPLGDMDNKKHSKVLIICATTEDVDSHLLTTFTRRIPMTISLPSLTERTLEERYELICEFFKIESRRIGKDITVSANALRSLALYHCAGNVGQLKSDIQLGCANAFLKCISKGKKRIEVHSTDFSREVKEGLLLYKSNCQVIDKIINEDMKLNFTARGRTTEVRADDYSLPGSFYEDIEKRIQELQGRGIEETEITFIMAFDIENYFKKFIRRFEKGVRKEELSKVVDSKIISIVESFLETASNELHKVFSNKVFYGLCLHLSSSIERIKQDKKIINHNLREIIEKYPDEYALALHFSHTIEDEYKIRMPLDEVGFIAMFLCADDPMEEKIKNKPIVVVAMHGRSTASSMAEVANKLIGGGNVYAYDMGLDQKPKHAYKEIKDLIVKNHQGAGVLLLVDMGSLAMFGEFISEETGIQIKVIDMVTTIVVIECARKALMDKNIHEISEEARQSLGYFHQSSASVTESFIPNKDHIILTICTTGEGSAIKIKNIIEDKVDLSEKNVQVIPVALESKKDLYTRINKLSKERKVLAVVGTFNPNIYGLPFISTSELFTDPQVSRLKEIVNGVQTIEEPEDGFYDDIFDSLTEKATNLQISDFKPLFMDFLTRVKQILHTEFDTYKVAGLILHLVCAVERLVQGGRTPECPLKTQILKNDTQAFMCIKMVVKQMENFYQITFPDDEICFITMIIAEISE